MAEYIDRTALDIGYADPKVFIDPAHADGWNTAVQIINEAPAADVAPVVHGQWIYGEFDIPHCSECGRDVMPNRISPYCPNCGAKMDEEEQNGNV